MFSPAKLLIVMGIVLVLAGIIWLGLEKLPWFGRMPGDIHVERRGWSFHFPIVTSIIVSIILTILLNLFFWKR
jgi:hypothetical protein